MICENCKLNSYKTREAEQKNSRDETCSKIMFFFFVGNLRKIVHTEYAFLVTMHQLLLWNIFYRLFRQ